MGIDVGIDVKTVPVGDGCFVGNTEFSMITFMRVSEQKGLIEHCDPLSGRTVLNIEVDVDGESLCEITYIDRAYWTVTVNGRPAAPGEELEGTFSVNDKDRTIEIVNVETDYVC